MPKVRTPPNVQLNRLLVARIKYGMAVYGYDADAMARAAHISQPTWFRRLLSPGEFTVDELRRISQKIHIPLAMLLGAEPQ